MGKTTNDAKYRKSSDYITSSDRYLDDLGDTEGSWKNYADGKKYVDENGQIVISPVVPDPRNLVLFRRERIYGDRLENGK